jgi:hypothetical protein
VEILKGGPIRLSQEIWHSFRDLSEEFRFKTLAHECAEFPIRLLSMRVEALEKELLRIASLEDKVRRLDDRISGAQSYRRGCENFYGTDEFGFRGEGFSKTLGLSLLKRSADLGDSDGQFRYGRCLLSGEGGERDVDSGVEYLRQSAEEGNAWAEAEYGKCLLDGLGLRQDIGRGIKYVKRSAGKSNPRGMSYLGSCLENGIGIKRNLVRAAEYYRLSADQWNSEGQFNLGRCLENGIGIERNLVRAAELYRWSAERGNPQGQVCHLRMEEEKRYAMPFRRPPRIAPF